MTDDGRRRQKKIKKIKKKGFFDGSLAASSAETSSALQLLRCSLSLFSLWSVSMFPSLSIGEEAAVSRGATSERREANVRCSIGMSSIDTMSLSRESTVQVPPSQPLSLGSKKL